MTEVDVSHLPRVCVSTTVRVPLSAASAWGQMRDFAWFTTLDPFHAVMRVHGRQCIAGARISIEHNLVGFRLTRVGRILKWTEGVGYSFSDLSKRDAQQSFPHVYSYAVEAVNDQSCRIRVTVRGRWSWTFLPGWCVGMWLRFVMSHTGAKIRIAMWRHARKLAKISTSGVTR